MSSFEPWSTHGRQESALRQASIIRDRSARHQASLARRRRSRGSRARFSVRRRGGEGGGGGESSEEDGDDDGVFGGVGKHGRSSSSVSLKKSDVTSFAVQSRYIYIQK